MTLNPSQHFKNSIPQLEMLWQSGIPLSLLSSEILYHKQLFLHQIILFQIQGQGKKEEYASSGLEGITIVHVMCL